MEDSLSTVFSIIVALIIMFIVPLMDAWELQDNIAYVVTYSAVTDFVNTVRNTGYISINNYSSFESVLLSTGNTYSITMEHKALNQSISDKMKSNTDGGMYNSVYLNTYTQAILKTLYAGRNYKMNKYDSFYVTVKNTNRTQASILNSLCAADGSNFKIGCTYGGTVWAVRDDN